MMPLISNLRNRCEQSEAKRENLRREITDLRALIEFESGKIVTYLEIIGEIDKEAINA